MRLLPGVATICTSLLLAAPAMARPVVSPCAGESEPVPALPVPVPAPVPVVVVGPATNYSVSASASVDVNVDVNLPTAVEANAGASATSSAEYLSGASATYQGAGAASGGVSDTFFSTATPLTTVHWEGALAMAIPIDNWGGPNVHAAFGLQVDSVRVAAEYSLSKSHMTTMDPASTWRTVDHWGQNQRFGVAGRYRLDMGETWLGMGVYGEAGLGLNFTSWKTQAETHHGDVMAGLGFEMLAGERRRIGMDMGFRFIVREGEGPAASKEVASVFTLGMLFGK